MRKRLIPACAAALLLLAAAHLPAQRDNESVASELMYVGTGTSGASHGIYAYRFHPGTGVADFLGLEAATPNPTFLVVARNWRTLYGVNEGGGIHDAEGNKVSAFRIDAHNGQLKLLNRVSSAGIGPCDLALAHKARFLLVSNCGSGSVALLPILPDGSLAQAASVVQHHGSSINLQRQLGPHAHGLAVSLDDRYAFVADLGIDRIFVHPIDLHTLSFSAGSESTGVTPGGGVRHLAFNANGRFLYSIDELDSTLTEFRYATGRLDKISTQLALPNGAQLQLGGSEIAFDSSGRFLYVSIRGNQNKIGVYSIDPHSGLPRPLQFISSEGKTPRNFALDLSDRWLAVANQNSHSIVWLKRDVTSGRLQSFHKHDNQVDSPMCIVFIPSQ